MRRVQFFFDESGKSNFNSSAKSGQTHLIIAGILVPWESDFWDAVKAAWELASKILRKQPAEIELHGWELYGGKGQWAETSTALPVIESIFSSLKKHKISIYWAGLPIEYLRKIEGKPWERLLVTYLDLLHQKLIKLECKDPVEIYRLWR